MRQLRLSLHLLPRGCTVLRQVRQEDEVLLRTVRLAPQALRKEEGARRRRCGRRGGKQASHRGGAQVLLQGHLDSPARKARVAHLGCLRLVRRNLRGGRRPYHPDAPGDLHALPSRLELLLERQTGADSFPRRGEPPAGEPRCTHTRKLLAQNLGCNVDRAELLRRAPYTCLN